MKVLNKYKYNIFLFVLFLLSIPAIYGLLHPGFFVSDDGEWMIIRFSAFYQELVQGQFPVRFLGRLNHEYGYPVANFLYPGFMYLGIPIHVLGFGFVDTIKIIFGASMVGSAIFCYLWLSRFFDKLASFIGSLFYLYTPYHLFDIYKRGSIGEILVLAAMPFVLWQIERKSFFWSAIGIGLLIISHNTLALLFLPVIFIYAMLRSHSPQLKIYWYTGIFVVGSGLSSFFWIPAFLELQYTVFSQTQISNVNAYFSNIDLIGFSTLAILLVVFLLLIKSHHSSSEQRESRSFNKNSSRQDGHHMITRQARTINFEVGSRLTVLFFIVGLLSVLFSTSLSTPLWNILPVSFIQFPFRLLSLTIVPISFLTACIISTSPKKLKIPISVVILIILTLSAKPFLAPSEFFDKGEGFYVTNMDTTTVKNEYMPKWVIERPTERTAEKIVTNGKVSNLELKTSSANFTISTEHDSVVQFNKVYFPGWNAIIDGKEVPILYGNPRGIIEILIPSGIHHVLIRFGETWVRTVANAVSLLSLLVLIGITSPQTKRLFRILNI